MDGHFLSKEGWNTIVELVADQNKDVLMLKRISTGVKTAFTVTK
jgi:hypothetical protein